MTTAVSSGKWAIVTGASSGIGRALAIEFARDGYNVFLTGRNADALKDTSDACTGPFHVRTEILAADLSRIEEIDRLVLAIRSSPHAYAALVNNAGFGIHGDFASTDLDQEIDLIHLQLAAALKLTKTVLPAMQKRGAGNILNVSSVYAFGPVPSQAVYAASKAFLLSFSAALHQELSTSGIRVTVFCPGVTQTKFRSRAGIFEKDSKSGISAETAARIAFAAMKGGQHVVVPGFSNRVFALLSRILPTETFASMAAFVNRRRGVNR